MSIVCPTVLASSAEEYKVQMNRIAPFTKRVQIDLKDGDFTQGESVALDEIWWPENIQADIHMMYRNPQDYLDTLVRLKPSMVIVHAESNCDVPKFASDLRNAGIKTGVAILQGTTVSEAAYIFPHVQHLLIFSGDLGHFGGQADLSLTVKIAEAKALHIYLEIGWDGGINADNARQLAEAGVDVLNVGGAIQNAADPQAAYATIEQSLKDIQTPPNETIFS